ncbi:PepSY domain-containing protein [Brevundimonas sp. Marseille-Q4549]|jgi:uncharacterized iron-regulated membrane protein
MKKLQMMGLAAVALAGSAGGVLALTTHAAPQNEDAALLARASVALSQAVSIAEARTQGRAVEVALEGAASGPVWDVTTVGSAGEQKARIDATSGSILAVAAETEDRDQAEAEDGEEDDDGAR